MSWVMVIRMFLTVRAAATGLGLRQAAESLGENAGSRATIQIVEAKPDRREAEAVRALGLLEDFPGIQTARRISTGEMETLLEPWLGEGGLEADLPIPVMIDVALQPGAYARLDALRAAIEEVAPSARVDTKARKRVV